MGFRLKPPTLIHGQAPSSGKALTGRRLLFLLMGSTKRNVLTLFLLDYRYCRINYNVEYQTIYPPMPIIRHDGC